MDLTSTAAAAPSNLSGFRSIELIGIVKNGEIYHTTGYGKKEINTDKLLDSHTDFHLASISRVFVATAITQLVKQGKINLESKLLDYIPVTKLRDKSFKDITIKQMHTHTSGIPDWFRLRLGELPEKSSLPNKKLLFWTLCAFGLK